nr:ribonuclease H-like domain-containing protein [Tanacetum cinerariifolium]
MPNLRPCSLIFKCINDPQKGNPQHALKDKRIIDSGCSRHMTGNISYLSDFKEINGEYVAFDGNPKGGKISDKVQTTGSGISILLAVGTPSTGSGNLYCQWELYPGSGNAIVIDSGCSRHMTGNMSNLSDFEAINRGYVAFGGNPKSGKITGKGKIRTSKLDFDDVYFVKELKFNIFSVLQMCDKKNSVLFTDTKCVVLSPDFKLPDDNHVLLRVPRENNMYNVDLKNIIPSGDLTFLFVKATLDESNLWHKRLGHINFKTINKLVKKRELEFEGRKPKFEVHVSPSSSAQTKKHVDKTKREAKGKSPVESSTRYRNLSAKFKDFSDNSINEVNAIDSPVPAVGQISTNSTNTFSVVGPSNADVIPTHRKSSYQMNVKSAFLYGTIEEEVYVCQPLGFDDLDYPDKVYKVVKALYGLHQAPRA